MIILQPLKRFLLHVLSSQNTSITFALKEVLQNLRTTPLHSKNKIVCVLPWEFQHHPLQLNLHLLPRLSHLHNNLHNQYQCLPLQHPYQWLMFSLLQHQLQLYHTLHSLHVKANNHPYLLLALLIFLGTKFHLVTTCLCL